MISPTVKNSDTPAVMAMGLAVFLPFRRISRKGGTKNATANMPNKIFNATGGVGMNPNTAHWANKYIQEPQRIFDFIVIPLRFILFYPYFTPYSGK
jgi:hypothetical protein